MFTDTAGHACSSTPGLYELDSCSNAGLWQCSIRRRQSCPGRESMPSLPDTLPSLPLSEFGLITPSEELSNQHLCQTVLPSCSMLAAALASHEPTHKAA